MQTVNKLIEQLLELQKQGHGNNQVIIINNFIQIATNKGYTITLN